MAYDSEDAYMIYFGVALAPFGFAGGGQTWILQGQNWTNLTPTLPVSPPALQGAGLVDDRNDGYVVLFGGFHWSASNTSNHPQATWTFHAGRWTDRTATSGPAPPGEFLPAMTYDAQSGYVLLAAFNRSPASTSEFETWRYASGQWTNISGQVGSEPGAREQATLTYDTADSEAVLFGGNLVRHGTGALGYNDTWVFRNGRWSNVTVLGAPAPPPVSRPGSALTEGGHVVLFGGYSVEACAPSGPTNCSSVPAWVFVGGSWFNMSLELPGGPQGPVVGEEPNMAWDPALSSTLLVSNGVRTVWMLQWNSSALLPAFTPWRAGTSPGVPLPFTIAPLGGVPPYDISVCATNSTCVNWTGLANSAPENGSLRFSGSGSQIASAHVVDANGSAATFGFRVPVFNSSGPLTLTLQVNPDFGFSPLNVSIWVNVSGGAPPVWTEVYFGDGVDRILGPGSFVTHHNFTCVLLPASGPSVDVCGIEVQAVAHDAIGQTASVPAVPLSVCNSNVVGTVCYPPQSPPPRGPARPTSMLVSYSGLALFLGGAGVVGFGIRSRRQATRAAEARTLAEDLMDSIRPEPEAPPVPSREPRR